MRSVVRNPTPRCGCCQMPPRWCICAAQHDITCPLQIDLLSHPRELTRPSSTGNLITRVMPEAKQHVWTLAQRPTATRVLNPAREPWILHPRGRPAPVGADAAGVQVILLDGLWNETAVMSREVAMWGRLVSLPMTGASRFWLRAQQESDRFSTVEALLFLLAAFHLAVPYEALRVQFELHVYASLRSRGRKDLAAEFLAGSVLLTALPDFLDQLHTRRPLEAPSSV